MRPLATVAAMETRLGLEPDSLADADLARAEAALGDASVLVRAAGGATYLDDDGAIDAPEVVVTVAVQAALRAYRNPDGLSGESVDGYAWQTSGPTGAYLTKDEAALVKAATGVARANVLGTIRTPSAYTTDSAGDTPIELVWGL